MDSIKYDELVSKLIKILNKNELMIRELIANREEINSMIEILSDQDINYSDTVYTEDRLMEDYTFKDKNIDDNNEANPFDNEDDLFEYTLDNGNYSGILLKDSEYDN